MGLIEKHPAIADCGRSVHRIADLSREVGDKALASLGGALTECPLGAGGTKLPGGPRRLLGESLGAVSSLASLGPDYFTRSEVCFEAGGAASREKITLGAAVFSDWMES